IAHPLLRATLFPYTTLFRSPELGIDFFHTFPAHDSHGNFVCKRLRLQIRVVAENPDVAELVRDCRLQFFVVQTFQKGLVQLDDEDRKSTRLNSSHDQISYAV